MQSGKKLPISLSFSVNEFALYAFLLHFPDITERGLWSLTCSYERIDFFLLDITGALTGLTP